MDIKLANVLNALNRLQADIGSTHYQEAVVSFSEVQDDPGAGIMIECLTIKCLVKDGPATYDSYTSDVNKEITIELFPDDEKRPPRYTVQTSRDLERKV